MQSGCCVLDLLKERREVRHLHRAAHRDRLGDLAAGLFKAGLEGFGGVLAGREVGIGHRRGLAADLVVGIGAHRVGRVPHAERQPHDVRRQIGDPGGAGIGDDHRHFGLRHHRRQRDRRRREHEAGEDLHLVVGDQFGGDGLGLRAGRRAFVALDDLDLVRRDVLGVQLDVKIERLVDLVTEVGIGAAERQHDADFDGLSLGGPAHCEGQGGYPSQPILDYSSLHP